MRNVLAVAVILASPLAAKTPLLNVQMEWRPTTTLTELGLSAINLVPFQGKTFTMTPFTDARPEPACIGRNTETSTAGLQVTSRDPVAPWVSSHTQTFLTRLGLPLAEGPSGTVLSGQIMSFFVTEGSNYVGDVAIRVQVAKDGQTLWNGVASGAARHFGRSYKLENYNETLSDSLQEAWVSLVRSEGFLKALAQ